MNGVDERVPPRLIIVAVISSALTAIVVLLIAWGIDELREPPDERFSGEATVVEEGQEPDLVAAFHEAGQNAADEDGGKYQGDTFEVKRIELDLSNPHVTAYRVIVGPKG